jgi:pyridinium-3,5-biscarboxylic acid mononucleotide sulfurtransferase
MIEQHLTNQDLIAQNANRLVEHIHSLGACVIAFSGGVDSSVVAAAAFRGSQHLSVAATGLSPSVSQADREWARKVASEIGIKHVEIETFEQLNPNYIRNDSQRCYHCKSELYSKLNAYAVDNGFEVILSGTNEDDLNDYRPGLRAAAEAKVVAPLADLGFGKKVIREIASLWSLSVAERPAAPCLASRIAYSIQVTPEKLGLVESAEAYLRSHGLQNFRVRLHQDQLARIEIDQAELSKFWTSVDFKELSIAFQSYGFKFVTVDIGGLQSGSLNRSLNTH